MNRGLLRNRLHASVANIVCCLSVHLSKVLALYIALLLIAGLAPFDFSHDNRATVSDANGLEIEFPGTAYTSSPPTKLGNIEKFTIFLDFASTSTGIRGFEKIFGYFMDQDEMNFMVGQWKDGLGLSLRTVGQFREIHFGVDHIFEMKNRIRYAISYDGRSLVSYVDGNKYNELIIGREQLRKWDVSYPLVLGTDANGSAQWRGSIYEVAIYDSAMVPAHFQSDGRARVDNSRIERSLTPAEVRPVIHYMFTPEMSYEADFSGEKALMVRDLGKGAQADLVITKEFIPYKRVYLRLPAVNSDYWSPNVIQDMIVNVLGFLPLGIILIMAYSKFNLHAGACIALAVMTGFSISLTIELMQAFLPTRYSSMIDLLMNASGTFIGSYLMTFVMRGLDVRTKL